ncbi:tRNA (guanosine(46)-N7)-methyltransferase TrmB [soil metagenome]
MGQKKLVRFAAIKEYPHVLENPDGMQGKWQEVYAKQQPLTLELACGKGEYAVGLGIMHPEKNFLGVDIKGNRIYIGAKKVMQQQLTNVAFLRTQIDRIAEYFDPGEVNGIWLTFPDPQLRVGKLKKRLTHPVFLRKYQQFLTAGSSIHLKTDSPVLYRFTKKVIELFNCTIVKDYNDVYSQASEPELLQIKTHYEGLDIAASGKIFYLQFVLAIELPVEKDALLKQYTFENESGRGD